jgi:hypothetical protein
MPVNPHKHLHRTWGGFRKALRGGGNRSCTVTFNYGARGRRTLVAPNFKAACDDAAARWGADWIGEPCYSTPDTIYNDLTGWTKHEHGQGFGASDHWQRKGERFRRTSRSYH